MTEYRKESRLRSFLKGITWRIVATLTTITIAYLVTGKVEFALKIGIIEVIAKLIFYYLHERAWQVIPRGQVRKLYGKLTAFKSDRDSS